MAVEVRDVALEHYSASAVLVRFPNGEKVWLQQIKRLEDRDRSISNNLASTRAQVTQAQIEYARARSELRDAQAQRDKAVADLALAQDALRKANERADKAEAYIAAQGRSHRAETNQERFMLLELE